MGKEAGCRLLLQKAHLTIPIVLTLQQNGIFSANKDFR